MKSRPVINLVSAPLLLPGLILLLVNTSTSHSFYHVNSYKMVLLVLGLTLLALRHLPPIPSAIDTDIPWKPWLLLSIPLLATFPGLFRHGGAYNYNFRYELATNLALMLWAIYLYRITKRETDFKLLLRMIGLTILYNGCWALLERTGLHPLAWGEPVYMVKATFGHRNYFSGFLVVLMPLMAVFAVPGNLFQERQSEDREQQSHEYRFYLAVFLVGAVSLALAQTRAAIAACGVSLALSGYIYVSRFAPPHWRRWVLILCGCLAAAGGGALLLALLFPDLVAGSRFAQLLTTRAWLGRTLAWHTAITAIQSSPLVGYGLGSSYNLFFSFVDPDARLFHHEHSYNHAHSEILEFTQEGGILGLLALVGFWAWLIYRLFRLLKHPRISSLSLKILIGICGGIAAFHFHGSFSVAPRMIVTKLPLYTLIAMLLTLDAHYHAKPDSEQAIHRSPGRKVISGLPTLALLLVIWILYFPWALTQWEFSRIREEQPSYLQIRKLEHLTRLSPDIYAMDYLSARQIEYRQAEGLKKTLELTEKIIPYYRELGYKKAVQALLAGDLENARRLGLAFQERDRYYQPAIDLLMALAVRTGDASLFKEQFKLSVRSWVFSHQLVDSLAADDVRIQLLPGEDPLVVLTNAGQLTFQWSEKLLGFLFETARKNLDAKAVPTAEKAKYYNYLKQLILRQPWFQLNINPQFQAEHPKLIAAAEKYHNLNLNWQSRKSILEQEFLQTMQQTGPGDRKRLFLQHRKTLAEVQSDYDRQLAVVAAELKPATDWDLYLRKQQFADSLAKNLVRMIFPPGQ